MDQFWRFGRVPDGLTAVTAGHDAGLVALSVVIAIAGALAMLRAVSRFAVAETSGLRALWTLGGAVAMGFGIWAMHFVGMLAVKMPIAVTYDEALTTASFLPALLGSLAAVLALASPDRRPARLHVAAAVLGLSISAMHYCGMEAVRSSGVLRYDPIIFAVSIVGAYLFALAGLAVNPIHAPSTARRWLRGRYILAAALLGGAVAGMHYVAMAAAQVHTTELVGSPRLQASPFIVAAVLMGVALTSGIVWLASLLDQRLASTSAALRGSEMRNRTIIATMHDAHLLTDASGRVVSANPAATGMFGFDEAELIGQTIASLLPAHPAMLDRLLGARDAELLDRKQRGLEARRRDGAHFPIELLITTFELDRQRFFSATIRDLSEFAAHIKTTSQLVAAIDQTVDGIVIFDTDLRVTFANPAYKAARGIEGDVVGLRIGDLPRSESDREIFVEILESVFAGRVWNGKTATVTADGSNRFESVTAAPVMSGEKIVCFIKVLRDITKQTAMEQKLRQSQKLESIGQLAAGIAHEINTPSQFVRDNILFLKDAYSDLLDVIAATSEHRSEEAARRIAAALDAADFEFLKEEVPRALAQSIDGMGRITKIVRAMKEFSHPVQERAPSDLNHAIETTLIVATNEWKYVADVEFDFEQSLPRVPCMLHEFNQVILNIVVNAAHAIGDVVGTTGEKGKIVISTRREDPWVEIRIADTGTGMSDENKGRVFDPFFTTKEVGRGTGQGLSIAYAVIVERHGGSIDVETEQGKGSCFVIRLPMQERLASEQAPAAA